MSEATLTLGGRAIPFDDFASQGNAVLGIRDSGKSYTATYLAERLIGAGIPVVAFDPIGIWHGLRVPGEGKHARGFPVVIAGGEAADLPLTPASAPEITRAALAAGASIVFDLYSMELSKADWRKIVETCVRVMLYENKRHGLRHIFIEEAAEFVPQRVGPDAGRVYAEIEKLARMGGNSLLGYTLINQRPEEVNKAVLELCDRLFLHRQKGRHSITALSKWMDAADTTNGEDVRKSLPTLGQGECWLWDSGSATPVRLQVPQKLSFHPNRRERKPTGAKAAAAVNVEELVAGMRQALDNKTPTIKMPGTRSARGAGTALEWMDGGLRLTEAQLQKRVETATRQASKVSYERGCADTLAVAVHVLEDCITGLHSAFATMLSKVVAEARAALERDTKRLKPPDYQPSGNADAGALRWNAEPSAEIHGVAVAPSPGERYVVSAVGQKGFEGYDVDGEVPKPMLRVLKVLAQKHPLPMTAAQWAAAARMAPRGGAFQRAVRGLRNVDLVRFDGEHFTASGQGLMAAGAVEDEPQSRDELIASWKRKLDTGAQRMLDALIRQYPGAIDRANLADMSRLTVTGGAFTRSLGALRRAGLVEVHGRKVKATTAIGGDA